MVKPPRSIPATAMPQRNNQFNAYAQMLLGLSDDVQKGVQYILMTGREWQFGWYGQDRWQVTRNLTVSIGLRYEFYPLMTRSNGKGIERYDPTTNDVYMGGRGNVPEDAGISVSHKLFAPRVGIAYRLGENTVIRAGYGLNYDPIPFSRPLRGFYPLTINAETKSPNSFSYARTLAEGIPPVPLPDISTGIVPLPGDASERSPWSYIHRGYTQSWNLNGRAQAAAQHPRLRRLRRFAYRARVGGPRYQYGLSRLHSGQSPVQPALWTHSAHRYVGRLSELRVQLDAGFFQPFVLDRVSCSRALIPGLTPSTMPMTMDGQE